MLEKELLHRIGKRKETDCIPYIRTALSHRSGHSFLGISVFIHKPVISFSFFNHRQAFPLQIFDKGNLCRLLIAVIPHNGRNFLQSRHFGCPEAAFPGDKFILVVFAPYQNRLYHPVFPDGIGQLTE